MGNEKGMLASMTIQGLVIMLVAPLLIGWFNIPEVANEAFNIEVGNIVNVVVEGIGAIMVAVGRIRASKKITKVL